jgi:hypothetical protein
MDLVTYLTGIVSDGPVHADGRMHDLPHYNHHKDEVVQHYIKSIITRSFGIAN